VKRIIEQHRAGGTPVEKSPRSRNYDEVADLVAKRVEETSGRISAKRLLPAATAAGYVGSRARSPPRPGPPKPAPWGRERRPPADPAVAAVEPNYIVRSTAVPNDPSFSSLYTLQNTGQTVGGRAGTPGADIAATKAWDVTTGSRSIVVAETDSGFDPTHPDLAANTWSNPGGVWGCAAGTHGVNLITGACDPADGNGHGTHVAGTLGAVGDNGTGVTGVSWQTSIMG